MLPSICRVIEFGGVCDEICTVRAVFVMIECEEPLLWEELVPCEAFIAGLPHGEVMQSDQDRCRILEVSMLHNLGGELELRGRSVHNAQGT